jgi:hypothetical protein
MRTASALALAATIMAASSAATPTAAQAQTAPNEVESGYKGVIGMGVLGAELGFVVPALAGLDETWSFIVFPVIGAAGGAIGGYFLLEQPHNVELSVGSLMLGMALIIPSMVVTLAATAYDPGDEGEVVEGDGADEIAPDPLPEEDAEVVIREMDVGGGLVRMREGTLHFGVPALALRSSATTEEIRRYGAVSEQGIHLPLVSGTF